MRLDSAAVEALNLLPVGDMNKQDTIYGLLCEARTPGGQRTLADWIKQPLLDKSKIGKSLISVFFLSIRIPLYHTHIHIWNRFCGSHRSNRPFHSTDERLDMVECLVECNELREILHGDLLRRFPDLSFMAKKLHLKKIRLADLYKLYTIGEDKCHLFVCVNVFIYLSIYRWHSLRMRN